MIKAESKAICLVHDAFEVSFIRLHVIQKDRLRIENMRNLLPRLFYGKCLRSDNPHRKRP
ncbi:Uncharacterised protein [Vibrio cholerae]|nr:hypothetical protein DN39_3373 [Vibrio cholerae]CRZ80130.1 Uncharacterised protein [Vibrio cholerae]CRZ83057.1 Uncharacterised protein [Vibrio cholerae]CSB43168.1 Uncharacterised protein [Vibrio cholerae]CSB48129.1 Uncharacterised protein [Vibrio cholerae]